MQVIFIPIFDTANFQCQCYASLSYAWVFIKQYFNTIILQSASHPHVTVLPINHIHWELQLFSYFCPLLQKIQIIMFRCSGHQRAKIQCNHAGCLYLCHVPIMQHSLSHQLWAPRPSERRGDGLVCLTGYEMEICVPVLYHLRDKAWYRSKIAILHIQPAFGRPAT